MNTVTTNRPQLEAIRNLPIGEIAGELGISDDLASKRAIRGRALVARCLRSKGLVPGSDERDAADARDEEPS